MNLFSSTPQCHKMGVMRVLEYLLGSTAYCTRVSRLYPARKARSNGGLLNEIYLILLAFRQWRVERKEGGKEGRGCGETGNSLTE